MIILVFIKNIIQSLELIIKIINFHFNTHTYKDKQLC